MGLCRKVQSHPFGKNSIPFGRSEQPKFKACPIRCFKLILPCQRNSMPTPLSFIGLGIMGLPMAGHLLAAGHPITLHTRSKAKADPLLAHSGTWANTPADATAAAQIVFICVTDTPDVEAVVLGEHGILSAARPGLIVVDHSTISPTATRRFADAIAVKGAHFLDAPVSGENLEYMKKQCGNNRLAALLGVTHLTASRIVGTLRAETLLGRASGKLVILKHSWNLKYEADSLCPKRDEVLEDPLDILIKTKTGKDKIEGLIEDVESKGIMKRPGIYEMVKDALKTNERNGRAATAHRMSPT